MRNCLAFTFLLLSYLAQTQTNTCGFEENAAQVARTRQLLESPVSVEGQVGFNSIPVKFHFLHKEDSTGAYIQGMEDSLIASLNADFETSKLKFYSCAVPSHLYNDEFYDYVSGEFMDLLWLSYKQYVLNIYLFGSVGNGWLCGVYQGNHSVMVAYPCADDAASISHEIGHYLGLLHTFGPTSRTKELADGSNCESQGDLICDTPADPNRLELVNSDCIYHGTVEDSLGYPDTIRDANGDAYDPDVHNIMSYYGVFGCRNRFSPQQSDLMNTQVDLLMKTHYRCSDLFADFSIELVETTCESIEAQLSATIINPSYLYMWDINDDGVVDKTGPVITHLYDQPGKHSISLEIHDPERNRSVYRTRREAAQLVEGSIAGPFEIDFDDGLAFDYIVTHNAGNFAWQAFTLIDGNSVAYDVIERGIPDDLVFNVDLSAMTHPVLEFRYAYRNGADPGDTLEVSVDNCVDGYTELLNRGGEDLHTTDSEGHPVDADQWHFVSLDLSAYISDKTRIRFRTKGDEAYYVPVFLDDVVVQEDAASSVPYVGTNEFEINIRPNPTTGRLHLDTDEQIDAYRIVSSWGAIVASGKSQHRVDVSQLSPGVYFISLQSEGRLVSKRFVKL